jgi:hypothetical protein
MEEYLLLRPTYTKKVIFMIPHFQGGIGDFIKYFLFLVQLCIQKQLNVYFGVTELNVNKWLKMRYPELYYKPRFPIFLQHVCQLDSLIADVDYIIRPYILYNTFTYEQLYLKGSDVFEFTPEIVERSKQFPIEKYTSLHIRLGDKFLEIPVEQNQCVTDVRTFNQESVVECIQQNPGIMIFCDNLAYKTNLRENYNVLVTPFKIGHTCLPSTSDDIIMDTLTEFYLLAKSQHIYSASDSGFPKMAAQFYGAPFTQLKK